METIGQHKMWSYLSKSHDAEVVSCVAVRHGPGNQVGSFLELATKVAELQFRNRDYVLLYRGQNSDYLNDKGNTTLKPSLFRPIDSRNPSRATLIQRFRKLKRAEQELLRHFAQDGFLGIERLQRQTVLRWSILQHYEICDTPLLDVTHSLRIAASFASLDSSKNAYVFVLGVPNLSGAVTASAEAGVQIIRLASACPPSALRPHLQEGYLLGEYPEMADYEQKELYFHYEIDFGRRLIAKFRFDPSTFWKSDTFPKVAKKALYPTSTDDQVYRMALNVKQEIDG